MKRLVPIAIIGILSSLALAQQPLKILQTDVDEAAGTLTIMGTTFGMPNPEVSLAGQTLSLLSYTEDTNPATPKADSEILAELPSPIQPGTYLLRVADSLSPATEFDEFNVQIGGTSSTQVLIRSVEPSEDTQSCISPCAGTLLISGLNFGSDPTFLGEVSLFLPGQDELTLPILAFNPITQEMITELPIEFATIRGSLLLGVRTGDGQNEGDAFDFTLEGDADSNNELQTLNLSGTDLSLSQNGGTVSINDPDADPGNEIQTLTQSGNVLTLSGNGGSVTINPEDADADPNNEIQSIATNPDGTATLSGGGGTFDLNPNIRTDATPLNTALGVGALQSLTTGSFNLALGGHSLASNRSGIRNIAVGGLAMQFNTTGSNNTALGSAALKANNGSGNVAVGVNTMIDNTSGEDNTAMGTAALHRNQIGIENTAIGRQALFTAAAGSFNVAVGKEALALLRDNAFGNTAVGTRAGRSLQNGRDNIYLNHTGASTESGTIRIGTLGVQSRAYLAGVHSTDAGIDVLPVVVNSEGQLGTADAALLGLNLVRTVVVSPVPNDPAASGTALLTALSNVTDASASNPYLLRIEPGIYDLGASTLQMKEFV